MNRALLLTAAAAMLAAGCGNQPQGGHVRGSGEGVCVKVRRVQAAENFSSAGYVGTVEASRQAAISAPVSGTLSSVPVKEGERVSEGQPLAYIEAQQVISMHEAAKARLDQARDAWDRVSAVYGSGSISEADYIDMKTKLDEAVAAESAARKSLEKCCLKAPFGGVVQSIALSRGVEVSPGEPVMRIVDLKNPEIRFPLPEKEFPVHAVGERAVVDVPALGIRLEGTLRTKGVSASPLSHSYECTVTLNGTDGGLMPGMVCKVQLEMPGRRVVTVPSSAVMTDMDGRYVWTAEDGVAAKKYIVPGGYAGGEIAVESELSDGDLVIVEGSRKVSAGMRVKASEQ